MYSTEQLLDMLNKKLEDYKLEATELEEAADKSVNPSEYRMTVEYIKNKYKTAEKIKYIENVISNTEKRMNNLQSIDNNIGSNIRDKAIIRNLGYMHSGSQERIARLKNKTGLIQEKQRKFADKKYNKITKRIETQAEISSELKKTHIQEHNTQEQIDDIPDKIENYEQKLDDWRSLGLFGLFSGKELPNFVKKTLVFGYTVGSYAKKSVLCARLLRLKSKKAIYEEINKRVLYREANIINSGKVK